MANYFNLLKISENMGSDTYTMNTKFNEQPKINLESAPVYTDGRDIYVSITGDVTNLKSSLAKYKRNKYRSVLDPYSQKYVKKLKKSPSLGEFVVVRTGDGYENTLAGIGKENFRVYNNRDSRYLAKDEQIAFNKLYTKAMDWLEYWAYKIS